MNEIRIEKVNRTIMPAEDGNIHLEVELDKCITRNDTLTPREELRRCWIHREGYRMSQRKNTPENIVLLL